MGIPVLILILIFMFILCSVILNKTILGRYIYAVGGNEQAARASGIDVTQVKMAVYSISGVLAGLAGILLTSRITTGQPNAGAGFELDAIAAVVIGGISTFGGSGSILGCVIGALLMSIIANGMVILKISVYLQAMVIGVLVIVAVGLDQYKRKRSGLMNN